MILVVGNINYDILFPLERLPGPHEKASCDEAVTGFGGSAANTAWWLAKLGVDVSLAGAVGNDALGKDHLEHLRQAGVDIDGVLLSDTATGIAVVFSLGREKRMVRASGANMTGKVEPDLLNGIGLVYLSGRDIRLLTDYAALARDRGITVICGTHGFMESGLEDTADGFILNADEVRTVTGLGDPEEGIRALDSELAAVTLPAGGCLVARGIDVRKIPSPELDPVDRTGGGDAFAAGFLAGLDKGLDVMKCGEMGNRLAAEVIMGMGARPEIIIPEDL